MDTTKVRTQARMVMATRHLYVQALICITNSTGVVVLGVPYAREVPAEPALPLSTYQPTEGHSHLVYICSAWKWLPYTAHLAECCRVQATTVSKIRPLRCQMQEAG